MIRFLRFLLVGAAGSLLLLGETYALTEYVRLWYFWAFLISAVCNWTFLFFTHAFFTFKTNTKLKPAKYAVFVGIYCAALLVNACIVYTLTSLGGFHYLISILIGTAVSTVITFTCSRTYVYEPDDVHPEIARTMGRIKEHMAVLALALVVALIVLAPNAMLWREPEFKGIEMMMHDAENHYMARVAEISQGDIRAANTFLADKDIPYATPPLGEGIVAAFGKVFGMEPARASVVSKPISVFLIVLCVYALAFALSRSRIASLLAAAVPTLGYNLIAFSPTPFLDILQGSPSGGPFTFFSRLVNPSISAIFLFLALYLIYREFFAKEPRYGWGEKARWMWVCVVGLLVGATLYITPFIYTFLGLVIFLSFMWFLVRREYARAVPVFVSGCLGLLAAIPFFINYIALAAMPGYEHMAQFLGLVHRREFILGVLLPIMAAAVAFLWPKDFNKGGKVFFLVLCGALFISLNQQLITGTMLQPGHYHWYITKPLAGMLGGLLVGYALERFAPLRIRYTLVLVVLVVLVYNSMGFLAPWYQSTRAVALAAQNKGPLMEYLETVSQPQVVWTDGDTSDYVPIYTIHHSPNSVNVGSYPIPDSFFEHRLFLEYRLRGVLPKNFEQTVRAEAHHVGDRLYGLWLREQFGDPSAVPEEEFAKLVLGYKAFYALRWPEAFDTLGITMVAARAEDAHTYASNPALQEEAETGDFVIYGRR